MRYVRAVRDLALMLVMCGGGVNGAEDTKVLRVSLHPQEMSNWCWAASSQMAMEFMFPSRASEFEQCVQARQNPLVVFSASQKCCPSPADPACDETGWPI